MPNRRTFIKASVAVSASNLLLNSMTNATAEISQEESFNENDVVVIDQSLTEAAQFSNAISDLNIQTYQTSKDISYLWMNTLEPKLKKGGFLLAGLTRGAPLFFLEYLSKEYGMHLYYRIEHQIIAKVAFEHKVEGHIECSSIREDMKSVGEAWPTLAGKVIKDKIAEDRSWQGEFMPLLNLNNQAQNMFETPFSWMLVPIKKTKKVKA